MDMESRRRFVNSMIAATAAAMGGSMMFSGMPMLGQQTTVPEGGPPYVPMGGVQTGPDGVNGNPPPGPIGAGYPQQGGAVRGVVAVVAAVRRVFRGHSLRASIGSPGRGSNGSPEKYLGHQGPHQAHDGQREARGGGQGRHDGQLPLHAGVLLPAVG